MHLDLRCRAILFSTAELLEQIFNADLTRIELVCEQVRGHSEDLKVAVTALAKPTGLVNGVKAGSEKLAELEALLQAKAQELPVRI